MPTASNNTAGLMFSSDIMAIMLSEMACSEGQDHRIMLTAITNQRLTCQQKVQLLCTHAEVVGILCMRHWIHHLQTKP